MADTDRAQKFLSPGVLLAALLSAVAVALAARGFAASHPAMRRPAARAGAKPAHHRLELRHRIHPVGLAASLLGVVRRRVHYGLVAAGGLVESSPPAASVWLAALGLAWPDAAAGLWPAARAAAGPGATAARDPARHEALRPASLVVLGLGVAGLPRCCWSSAATSGWA